MASIPRPITSIPMLIRGARKSNWKVKKDILTMKEMKRLMENERLDGRWDGKTVVDCPFERACHNADECQR